jgi:hypothetical protein
MGSAITVNIESQNGSLGSTIERILADLKPADLKPADLKPADLKPADLKPEAAYFAEDQGERTGYIFLPPRKNLWVTGAFRTEPEGQQQAKTMPDSRAALSLFVASFLSETVCLCKTEIRRIRSVKVGSRKRAARVERLSSIRFN